MVVWPRSSCTIRRGTPRATRVVANVCRSPCHPIRWTPARSQARCRTYEVSSGRMNGPSALRKMNSLSVGRRRRCWTVEGGSGTTRPRPVFVSPSTFRSTARRMRACGKGPSRTTSSHPSAAASPNRRPVVTSKATNACQNGVGISAHTRIDSSGERKRNSGCGTLGHRTFGTLVRRPQSVAVVRQQRRTERRFFTYFGPNPERSLAEENASISTVVIRSSRCAPSAGRMCPLRL